MQFCYTYRLFTLSGLRSCRPQLYLLEAVTALAYTPGFGASDTEVTSKSLASLTGTGVFGLLKLYALAMGDMRFIYLTCLLWIPVTVTIILPVRTFFLLSSNRYQFVGSGQYISNLTLNHVSHSICVPIWVVSNPTYFM